MKEIKFHGRGGQGVVMASQMLGLAYFKEYAEKFKVYHVTEGLSPEQVAMMKYTYASTVQEAVDALAREMPQADVAVLPSGGNIIPEVR